ncbi:MAG: hypothetical protein ACM3PY_17345 [Omnitrophica WOR_2 bacterium]
MDNLFQSILSIQKRLLNEDIPSIVIGGMAVAAWGEPRLTRDVDLKVLLGRQDADQLLAVLSTNYKPLVPNPRETLRRQALLFIQDSLGTRLDLLLADTPYDVTAIQRGRDVEVQPGVMIHLCSPEDLIIYKLISTRLRDHEDAKGVVRRQGETLDDKYIIDWLRQFEVALDDSTLVNEYLDMRREHN